MNLKPRHFEAWIAAAAVAATLLPAAAQQTNRVNPRDFAAFQIINDRNIFDPNRRPRIEPRVRETPRAPQIVDTFSLVGTMSYSGKLLAFFDGTSSDYRKSLAAGERIATYTVADIQHNLVRLQSGTNQIDLKVGMQMRRSEDGSWSAADAPVGSFASYTGNRQRGNDRRSWGGRGDSRSSGGFGQSQPSGSDAGASENPAPNPANLDPSDPVARMMLRRMQEEGLVPPQNGAATIQSGPGQQPEFQQQQQQTDPLQQMQPQQQQQQQPQESQNELPANGANPDTNSSPQTEQPSQELRS